MTDKKAFPWNWEIKVFGATWSIWGPIWARTGFWRGPQLDLFRIRSTWNQKKCFQEGVLNKHNFGRFWCQNGTPWEAKTSISHYTCCNFLEVSMVHELWWKMQRKTPKSSKIGAAGAPTGLIFLILGRCRFYMLDFPRFPYLCGPTRTQPGPTGDPTETQLGSIGDYGQLGGSAASTSARYLGYIFWILRY